MFRRPPHARPPDSSLRLWQKFRRDFLRSQQPRATRVALRRSSPLPAEIVAVALGEAMPETSCLARPRGTRGRVTGGVLRENSRNETGPRESPQSGTRVARPGNRLREGLSRRLSPTPPPRRALRSNMFIRQRNTLQRRELSPEQQPFAEPPHPPSSFRLLALPTHVLSNKCFVLETLVGDLFKLERNRRRKAPLVFKRSASPSNAFLAPARPIRSRIGAVESGRPRTSLHHFRRLGSRKNGLCRAWPLAASTSVTAGGERLYSSLLSSVLLSLHFRLIPDTFVGRVWPFGHSVYRRIT